MAEALAIGVLCAVVGALAGNYLWVSRKQRKRCPIAEQELADIVARVEELTKRMGALEIKISLMQKLRRFRGV